MPSTGGSVASFARISIARDNAFRDNSEDQMTMMTPTVSGTTSDGYVAEVTVGISA